jgi:cytochrome c-type biogenesis protein
LSAEGGRVLASLGGGAGPLVDHSPFGFVVAFGGGLISFLSPCVLPLVPSYLSMMSGVGISSVGAGEVARKARVLWSSLLFVAGFSLVFAVLEAGASAIAHPLQAHKALLAEVAGAVIIAMGLVLAAGAKIPWLSRQHRLAVRPSQLGPWAAPVMGMTFAFAWTPCIGPVLASVLGLAASSGTLARGEAMLVAYSLGLGVPFVVTGVAFGRMSGALRAARRHARWLSLASGLLLAALGALMVAGQVGTLSSWTSTVLDHIGLGGLATS